MGHKIKELSGLSKKLGLKLHEVIKLYNERNYKMYLREFGGYGAEYYLVKPEIDDQCYNIIERYLTSKYSKDFIDWTKADGEDLQRNLNKTLWHW